MSFGQHEFLADNLKFFHTPEIP